MNTRIVTDPADMPLAAIHRFLSEEAYWCRGIPLATVERALAHSLCFCALDGDALAGFARVISDRATYAYLCDVFVLPAYRGRGLSKTLLRTIRAHPDLQGLRRWMLMTADAHTLYAQFGFAPLKDPSRAMEAHVANVYGFAAHTSDHPSIA